MFFNNRRNILSLLVSVMIVLTLVFTSSFAAVAAERNYKDVIKTDHYDAIMALTEKGYLRGYEDGSFGTWNNITREQVAVILYEATEAQVPSNLDNVLKKYDDVDEKHRYAKQIAAVTEAGFFKGNNGKFRPTNKISREQVATVIVLAEDLGDYKQAEKIEINLDKVNKSHENQVQTLADLKVTNQKSDFRPREKISRGAFATLLYQLINANKELNQLFTLDLMHTSDTHAHLNDDGTNVAQRVTAVNEFRSQYPDSLLLDSGDVFSGTLYFNEYHGQADLAFMNMMEYDAMTFGNHEFDMGDTDGHHKKLAEFIENAHFPIVSSNVDITKQEELKEFYGGGITTSPSNSKVYDGIIKEVKGEKVGIFGLTTEDTNFIASPLNVVLEPYIEKSQETVANFEEMGVDKIIAVTHIGLRDNPEINDINLAKEVEGIDVILGGHSHTKLEEPMVVTKDQNGEKKAPTLIDHTFQYGEYLGTLNVKFDKKGEVVGQASELVSVAEKEENFEAAELLKTYSGKVDIIMEEEIGAVAAHDLPNPRGEFGVRNSETALGNLITDGMLAEGKEVNPKVEIAFHNGGNIRNDIKKGPITTGQILTVMPFGNTLATLNLKGSEIKKSLEESVAAIPESFGGFLHVSGMKFSYDGSKPIGERLVSAEVKKDEGYIEIDDNEEYVVVTNAFIAKGGDGFATFEKAYDEGKMLDLGISDWENFRDYLVTLSTESEDGKVSAKIEERIKNISK